MKRIMNLKHLAVAAAAGAAAIAVGAACTPINCHTDHSTYYGYAVCDSGDYRAVIQYFSPTYGQYKQAVGPHMANGNYSWAQIPDSEINAGAYVTSVWYEEV